MKFFIKKILITIMMVWTMGIDASQVKILLIRHGETDWNLEGRVQGQSDIPLNPTGLQQAEELAERLKREHADMSAIYSSDLQRAYCTAEKTAELLGLPVETSAAFREIHCGESEGMLFAERNAYYKEAWEELHRKYPHHKDRWHHSVIPGAETAQAVLMRVKEGLKEIGSRYTEDTKIALFSHGRAIKILLADTTGMDTENVAIPNCHLLELVYDTDTGIFSILE